MGASCGVMRWTLAAGLCAAAAGCSAPTLDAYNADRDRSLTTVDSMTGDQRLLALRERVLRESMAQLLVQRVLGAPVSCFEGGQLDIRCAYLVGPLREKLAEDYSRYADALRDSGDADSALAAYEDAIAVADTQILSRTAAARVRSTALRGEEKLWSGRREPARAAAAKVMAQGEDAWLGTPEAAAASSEYEGLLAQSRSGMQQAVTESNAQVFSLIQASLQSAQQNLVASQAARAGGSAGATASATASALTPVLVAAAKRVAATLVTQLASVAPNVDLGPLRDLLGVVPGLFDAVKAGRLDAFAASDAGKKVLGDVYDAMRALRRGQPMAQVKTLVAAAGDAAGSITSPPTPTAAPAPTPAPPPTPAPAPGAEKVDVKARLDKLQKLHDDKTISDEEYRRERERILKEGL